MRLFFTLDTNHDPCLATLLNRHVGDLDNITTDSNGSVSLDMTDSIIQLNNVIKSIINRTVIMHRMRDDGSQGGFSNSTTTDYEYILF